MGRFGIWTGTHHPTGLTMNSDFDYYKAVSNGIHPFVYSAIEHVKKHVKQEKGYVSALSTSLHSLHEYAEAEKAEGIILDFPICPNYLSYIEHEADPGKIKIKEKWREGVWKFKNGKSEIYAGNLSYFHGDYEELYACTSTFIIASNKKEVSDFIDRYHKFRWAKNRQGGCVFGYNGEKIEDFRKMRWEDIYLLNNMVNEIRNEMDTFFKSEALYKKHGLDWKRGMMLAGKPGNGKTAICRAIATNSKVPIIYCALDGDDMFRILDRVERTIRANAPCIVIFEDADTLGSNPALRSAMLNMLDGLFTTSGVFTVASTNCPDKLDEAFTGRPSRFDSFFIIGDPDIKERTKILLNKLGDSAKGLNSNDLKELIKNMSGISAACVQEVAVCALLQTVKTGKPVNIQSLTEALEKIKKHMRASSEGVDRVTRGSIGFASKVKSDDW